MSERVIDASTEAAGVRDLWDKVREGRRLTFDDGARLYVNDELVIDAWRTGAPKGFSGEIELDEGTHRLRLEYFDARYDAQVHLSWERVGG